MRQKGESACRQRSLMAMERGQKNKRLVIKHVSILQHEVNEYQEGSQGVGT